MHSSSDETPTKQDLKLPKGYVLTGNTLGKVPIIRDTRAKDHYDKQAKFYSPCTCGSGKKYKFCCKDKKMIIIDTGS